MTRNYPYKSGQNKLFSIQSKITERIARPIVPSGHRYGMLGQDQGKKKGSCTALTIFPLHDFLFLEQGEALEFVGGQLSVREVITDGHFFEPEQGSGFFHRQVLPRVNMFQFSCVHEKTSYMDQTVFRRSHVLDI